MFDLPESAILFSDSARGIYIPQHFAESVKRECVSGISPVQFAILRHGPEDEFYWDVWNEVVESNAIVTDPESGIAYTLFQDGDLWLVPTDWTPDDY